MVCPNCGRQADGRASFCRECGTPLLLRCPDCGSEEPAGARFCGACGRPLEVATSPSTAVPGPSAPAADERNVTVVFADISRYTALSEAHEPGDMLLFMAEWYHRVQELADRYDAMFKRAEGDCVMLVLGAPKAPEDQAERACRLAIEVRECFADFMAQRPELDTGASPLQLHIGVNTGPAAAGPVEGGAEGSYEVIGHTVNQAKRLQTMAPAGAIYAGEGTYARAHPLFVWRSVVLEPHEAAQITGSVSEVVRVAVREAEAGLDVNPFVGRERELAELLAVGDLVRAGSGQAVSVMGEAGIGKTRLVAEFARALSEDFQVVWARTAAHERSVPYHTLAQLLRGVLPLETDAGGVTAGPSDAGVGSAGAALTGDDVVRVRGLLGHADPPAGAADNEERRRLTRRVIRRVLLPAASARPVMLVVDDAQWMDPSSLEVLGHLVPWLTGHRVLLVGVGRAGPALPWPDASHGCVLVVGRLSERESTVVAQGLLDEERSAASEEIARRAGGNPLFIRELARAESAPLGRDLPASVRDLVMGRVDQLDHEQRRFLAAAAVVGPRFTAALVAKASGIAEREARVLAADLAHAGWLRLSMEGGRPVCEFDHGLLREVAYSSLLRRDRMALHRRVAEAIEAAPEDGPDLVPEGVARPEVLAHHLCLSDAPERAIPHLLEGMRRADARDAHSGVAELGARLLELLDRHPAADEDGGLELDALGLYARACVLIGRSQEAMALLARQRALAQRAGAVDELAMSSFLVGRALLSMGQVDRALEGMRAALALWSQQGNPLLAWYARLGIAACHSRRCELEAALEEFDRCLATREVEIPAPLRAVVHQNYGEVCTSMGRFAEALSRCEQAEALLQEPGAPDVRLLANIGGVRAKALLAMGEAEQAKGCLETALSHAERAEDVTLRAEVLIDLGYCCRRLGQLDEAVRRLQDGTAAASDAEAADLVAMGEARMARMQMLLGDVDAAQAAARRALEGAERVGHHPSAHVARLVLADVAELRRDAQTAGTLRREAVQLAQDDGRRPDEVTALLGMAQTHAAEGDADAAADCCERALAMAEEAGSPYLVTLAAVQLAHHCVAHGRLEAAACFAARGIETAAATHSADLLWRAHYAGAQAAKALGRPGEARHHYARVLAALNDDGQACEQRASAGADAAAVEAEAAMAEL
jgi:adenylate cyclase